MDFGLTNIGSEEHVRHGYEWLATDDVLV